MNNLTKKKDKDKEESPEVEPAVATEPMPSAMPIMISMSDFGGDRESKVRAISLYGDLEEKLTRDIVMSLVVLYKTAEEQELSNPEDPESEIITVKLPVEFYISTHGGSAAEMFSIYDTMEMLQADDVEVHTYGFGKVMSAGVLLLAKGTKGKRKIGKNCRVMIHGVSSGQIGHIHDLENEMEETKFTQKQYLKRLSEETAMTQKYLKNLVARKTNVYFTADEAVELGIADIII